MQKNGDMRKDNIIKRGAAIFRLGVAVALVGAICVLAAAFNGCAKDTPAAHGETRAVISSDSGVAHVFSIKIARTGAEKRQGLQHVPHLPEGHGMLFAYDAPMALSMWMKDTLIPLDMIFMRNGRIVEISPDAVPGSEALITPAEPVDAVLEIGGGEAKRLGIAVGDAFTYDDDEEN